MRKITGGTSSSPPLVWSMTGPAGSCSPMASPITQPGAEEFAPGWIGQVDLAHGRPECLVDAGAVTDGGVVTGGNAVDRCEVCGQQAAGSRQQKIVPAMALPVRDSPETLRAGTGPLCPGGV